MEVQEEKEGLSVDNCSFCQSSPSQWRLRSDNRGADLECRNTERKRERGGIQSSCPHFSSSIMASASPQKRMVSFFITLASPYRATVTQHQHTRTHSATANDMPRTAMRVGPEDSSTRKLSVSGTQQGTIHRQERAPSESQGSTHEGVQSSTPSLARHSEPRTPASTVTPDLSWGLGDTQQQQTKTEADKGPEELLPPPPVSVDAELTEDPTPLLPPPPVSVDAELTEDPTPLLPPPPVSVDAELTQDPTPLLPPPPVSVDAELTEDPTPLLPPPPVSVDAELTEDPTPLLPPPPVSVDDELTEDPTPLLPPPLVQEPPTAPLLQPVSSDRPPVSDQLSAAVDRQLDQSTPSSGGEQKEASQRIQGSPEEQLVLVETKEVCGFCRKPVALSETAIEALNRTYHASCFQCRQCHIPLAGKLYYNKAGIPLCKDCYQASLELCWACGEVIKDQVIHALERAYHPPCFICATCSQPIGEQSFAQGEVGEVYCLQDYYRKYAPQCSACQQLIIPREDGIDSYTVECLGRSFHEDCYRCLQYPALPRAKRPWLPSTGWEGAV
ncbi:uncharacterized protein ACWYII_043262 isoform 2-T2 [Salvelinus alpinus]